jgi:starvation-inducible DNA-binding protein
MSAIAEKIRKSNQPGLRIKEQTQMVTSLSIVLANTFALYLKTLGYHWNVRGPQFITLHDCFGKQHLRLAQAADEIAERIRMLDSDAPCTFTRFMELARIEADGDVPDASTMTRDLLLDHQAMVHVIRDSLHLAYSIREDGTADLLVDRLKEHEKLVWVLNSLLAIQ